MPLVIPAELKKITPFIRRAEELDKDKNPESRLVAYYCRQYAVHSGISLAVSKTSKDCLGMILNELEKEKGPMSSFTRDEAKYVCREFADKVFTKADEEDRAGVAGKSTARTFYAAASFFEVLQQFYPDDDSSPEREEEKKRTVYSKWKATDILKAIKEGRKPTPGGYGEEEEANQTESEEAGETAPQAVAPPEIPMPVSGPVAEEVQQPKEEEEEEEEQFPSLPTGVPSPPPQMEPPRVETVEGDDKDEEGTEVELGPPPAYPGSVGQDSGEVFVPMPPPRFDKPPIKPAPAPAPPMPSAPLAAPAPKKTGFLGLGSKKPKTGKVSKEAMADALELTKFATAALEAKDTDLAATRLRQALEVLGR